MCAQRQIPPSYLKFQSTELEFYTQLEQDAFRLLTENYPLEKQLTVGPLKFWFVTGLDYKTKNTAVCFRSLFEHAGNEIGSHSSTGFATIPEITDQRMKEICNETAYALVTVLKQRGYTFTQ